MKRIIILILLSFQGILAQVQFEAKVSKNTLGLNERLRIDFTMNDDGDNFTPPSFEGFRIVGGPSQQVSQSWINGRSSFNKSYSYFLLPTQKGILSSTDLMVESLNNLDEKLISYVSKLENKDFNKVDISIPEPTGIESQKPTIGREEQIVKTSDMVTNNITNNTLAQQIANPITSTQNNATSFDGKLTIEVNVTAPPGVDTAAIKEVVTQTMHDTKVRANIIQGTINPRVGSYSPTTVFPDKI